MPRDPDKFVGRTGLALENAEGEPEEVLRILRAFLKKEVRVRVRVGARVRVTVRARVRVKLPLTPTLTLGTKSDVKLVRTAPKQLSLSHP